MASNSCSNNIALNHTSIGGSEGPGYSHILYIDSSSEEEDPYRRVVEEVDGVIENREDEEIEYCQFDQVDYIQLSPYNTKSNSPQYNTTKLLNLHSNFNNLKIILICKRTMV